MAAIPRGDVQEREVGGSKGRAGKLGVVPELSLGMDARLWVLELREAQNRNLSPSR